MKKKWTFISFFPMPHVFPLLSFLLLSFLFSLSSSFAFYRAGKIALIQYNADKEFGNYEANRHNLTTLGERAIQSGANILVFPEGSTWGYASAESLWCFPHLTNQKFAGKTCRNVGPIAESIPQGRTTLYWQTIAKTYQVYILYHLIEKAGSQFFNTLAVVGPEGYINKYRKRNLYWVDKLYATPGQDPVVLKTPFGEFGLMICMDATYDGGFYTEYKSLGVDALLLSMDWDQNTQGPRNARTFFPARALRNGLDLFVSDVSTWDGTGKYSSHGGPRERNGLPEIAIGLDGFSLHAIQYRPSPEHRAKEFSSEQFLELNWEQLDK